ncbi:cadherin domain-containing protein [Sphaerotilus montanus]|uniref:Cadherin domain-containing protein n=1 Tax=Sphaerotilus montanus TaxID=522889 RepID=A0A7Y9UC17_9BURK|nr:cadherin domain-containing protein [Sphaerotilus montanus]NYG33104.1 hypothetical protein [Sphaerotilus montanus]NZD57076.1 cadherin domain-containing protein [Sphaerotilus montanus]
MPSTTARVRARVLMETLEPRILYSADLAAVAALAGGDVGWVQEQRLQATTQTADQTVVRTEIAFVDLGIPEARSLVGGLLAERVAGRPIEVVPIAADEDGLAVISRTLDERQAAGETFDAVHVFSHGQSGVVALGTSTLDADSLLRRAGEIADWGSALSAQADLMLYGCDVAAGANGLFLIEGLAALTGADVAASDDLTGSAARGGDWLLEQHTGQIEATVAADAALQQTWDGVLGSETQVNLTTAGNQNTGAETRGSQQAVALDAAGNYTVVWTSGGQDGGGKGVYVRRFASDGTALTGEIQVNTTTAKDQENARIVGDASGQFAVVWTSQDQDGTTASVYFRRFAANGTALTGEIRANASDSGDQLNAVIGLNSGNGDLVVAWEGDGPGGQSVFFRRFAQDGTALDATDRAAGTLNGELNPAVAMDATGRFVIAWNDGQHIRFQRYDAAGVAAGALTQVDGPASDSFGPAVAIDDQGNFAVAYREQSTMTGLWGLSYTATGTPKNVWFYADTGDATSPSIALAPDGSAVVTYQKSGDGDGMGIYARKISASGVVQGAPILVNQSTAKDQVAASVAVRDADHFVVAWSGDSAADKDGVYARTFEPANTPPLITTNGGASTAAVSVAENTTAVTTVGANDVDWPVQTIRYSIVGGADQARFSIDSASGALRFVAAPDFEQPADAGGDNLYEVTVQASDLLLATTQALAVTVTDVADQIVAEADTATTPHATAVSIDVLANDRLGTGSTLTLLDIRQPAHGQATVVGGEVVYTPDAGFVGTDTLQYRVVDGSEGLAAYWALDDDVGSLAGEPGATAGVFGQALQFDGVDDRVGLTGVTYTSEFTLSYWFKLADNTGTGYRYLYADGTAGVQNSLNIYFIEDATSTASGIKNVLRTSLVDSNDGTAITNTSALDIPVTGLLDNRWHQYTLTTVTGTGSSVYIDGTLRAISSQGGDTLTTSGSVLLGANSTLSAARFLTGALDDVALYHHTTAASAVAALESGPGAIGTVTLDVVPANTQTPVITSGGGADAATVSVAENGTAVTVVTAYDTDVGGPALAYTIVGGADQARFSMDAASGAVVFRTVPDFEQPADTGTDNVYDLTVQVSDGVHVDTQQLRVVVTDANEYAVSPITDADPGTEAVDENAAIGTTVGFTASAVDADGTTSAVTYSLDDSAGGRFAIDATTGVVKVAGLLDAETASSHTLLVRAASIDGSNQTLQVTVAVRDLDEARVTTPVDADGAPNTVSERAAIDSAVGLTASAVDADATNNTVTYTLTDNAGGRFAIDASSGVVTVASALDAETALSHTVTVQARSTDGSVASQSFTIVVQDVNESAIGAVTDLNSAAESVREDAVIGTAVGFQAHAVDADATNHTITYALALNYGNRFAIDAASGVVTVAAALDAETTPGYLLLVRAVSSDGSFSSRWLGIGVQDVNEFSVTAPIDANSATNAVNDNAAVDTRVGIIASARDADATRNQITYALADDAAGRFKIDSGTGVVRLARSVAADSGSTLNLVLQATSADGSVATQALTVAVSQTNLYAPVIQSDGGSTSAALAVQENSSGPVTTVVATDADVSGVPLSYQIVGGADAARFTLDAGTGVLRFVATPDAEQPIDAGGDNRYDLIVEASDGVRVDTQTLSVVVQDVNEAAISALADVNLAADTVQENAAIGTVVGVQALAGDSDATNNTVTYTLGDTAGGRFAIDASTGVVTVAGLLDAEAALSHTILVRAASSDGSATTLALTIGVLDVNEYGVGAITDADGQANSVREDDPVGTTVGLTAQAQDLDATANAVTYSLADDAGGRFAIDETTGVVTIAQALDAEAAQSHGIVVRALSADGSVQTQAFSIAVRDVDEFDLVAINDVDGAANAVAENAAVGTRVGITAQSVDADVTNNSVTYSLDDTAGGRFAIDAGTGVVTVAGLLDAETALSHTILVRAASSDGSTTTLALTIAVQDVNEYGVGAITDADAQANSVREDDPVGTTVGLTAQAQDLDATANAVTYSLSDNAGGRFAIDATTGVVTIAQALDAEVAQSHSIVVRALSTDGSVQTQAFSIAVRDVDEFDLVAINDVDGAANAVAENAAVGTRVGLTAQSVDADATSHTVAYALLDSAGGHFAIDATTGVITVAGALDAEMALAHTLVVQATSADGSLWTQAFTVRVTDVDEFDLVAVSDTDAARDAVAENAAVGTAVGLRAGSVDADVTTHGITYTLDDSAGGCFAVDAATGVVTLARAVPDEGVATRTVVLRATSADGSTVAASFDIAILPVNEQAPVIDSDGGGASAALVVDEGQMAVAQVLAHDDDLPADTLRYRIAGGADAALFTLDASTGVLRFAAAPDAEAPRDQGADNVYEVRIQVSDGLHTDEQALRITVQPLNDTAPVITSDGGGATAVRYVAENALAVTQVQARDADWPIDTLTYAVSGGADAALFTVDATTGALRWRAAPDRETPRDAGADGVYDVTVRVSDGLHTASQSLTVVVDNVDEAPRLDTNALAVLEGGMARPVLLASDVDTPAAALVYTVQDLTGGRFEQATAPGVAVTRFTQAEVDAGAIRLVADGHEAAPAYRLVLADATTTLAPQAAQVAFTPVNDAPVSAVVDLGTVDEDTARVITVADLLAGASDAEGDALSVSTLRLTGGDGVLVDLGGGRWRFDPAADWHGAVTLAGEVSDGQAGVALVATLQVRAVNDAPRITSSGGAVTLALDQAENTPEVTTVVGADVDADAPLHYAVVGGADAARFQIDAATGVLAFRQAPDREQAADADGDNRYDVLVEVSDGALTAQQALQITVTNIDEAPVVMHNVALISDGRVTLVLHASDQDTPATALTYRVDSVQGGQFELSAAPGQAVTMFTQADLDAARVTWVAPVGSTATAFALRLSDGHSEVRIGSPTPQRQAVEAAEMTLVAVAAGDTSAAPSAGDSAAATTAAPVAAVARRSDPVLPPPADSAGDDALGLGARMAEDAGSARGGGVRPAAVDAPVIRSTAVRAAAVAEPPAEVALDLPSEGAEAPRRLVTDMDLWGSRNGTSLAEQMDRLRQEVADAQQAGMVSLASTALVSTGLSVGYVIWLVRGGVLMTSLMSVVPAWAGMDPLPVLAEMRRHAADGLATDRTDDDGDSGDDPIEQLFSKARRLLVRPAAGSPVAPEPPEGSA